MLEGKLLFEEFKKAVQSLHGVKRAWFTTFTLDVHFFERYLLPVITGVEERKAFGIRDFEEMNSILSPKDNIEDVVEVKVFYDFNTMVHQQEPKRTCISLHPVDTRSLAVVGNPNFFSEGVFHPKVAVIEGKNGDILLMVASANLTLGGWSKNRECFFIRKLSGVKNAREIGNLFNSIGEKIPDFLNNPLLNSLNYGRNWGENDDWIFFSSFSEKNIWEELNVKGEIIPLSVWSPYWAEDLSTYISQLVDLGFSPIRLLPSKNGGKIGILKDEFKIAKKIKEVSFEEEHWKNEDVPFIHAKVWMTPDKVAIGSWNATRAGIHLPIDPEKKRGGRRNNVEAGVIINLGRGEHARIVNQAAFKKLSEVDHPTEKELREEKEQELAKFSFPIEVKADWKTAYYYLNERNFPTEIEKEIYDYFVILPGVGKKPLLQLKNGISFHGKQRMLLVDRMFIVEDKEQNTLFRGYMIEDGLEDRPIYKFESEMDLLLGWLEGRPEEREEIHKPNLPEDENEDPDSDENQSKKYNVTEQPWLISLQAFVKIRNRIEDIQALGLRKDRRKEFMKLGRCIPGSLSELREHILKRKEQYEDMTQNDRPSPVYLWFLIIETNKCIRKFNRAVKAENGLENELVSPIADLDFIKFIDGKNVEEVTQQQVRAYLGMIKKIIHQGR